MRAVSRRFFHFKVVRWFDASLLLFVVKSTKPFNLFFIFPNGNKTAVDALFRDTERRTRTMMKEQVGDFLLGVDDKPHKNYPKADPAKIVL